MKKPTAEQIQETGYRTSARPEVVPACRNCKFVGYDSDDRLTLTGSLTFKRVNVHCRHHGFMVSLVHVCNVHQFHRPDRSDK